MSEERRCTCRLESVMLKLRSIHKSHSSGKSEEIKEEGKQLMTFVIYTRRSHTPSIMFCALFDRLFDTVVVRTYVRSPVIPPLWETKHSHSLYVDPHPNGQCRL